MHRQVTHHGALPWCEVPAFVRQLGGGVTMPATKLVFEFLILTTTRSGEARGALWEEIDLATKLWTIPAFDPVTGRRMKSNETHVVPMSDRAIAILREARKLHEGPVVFPGGTGSRCPTIRCRN